jgi:SAM-dependent methyltransferase
MTAQGAHLLAEFLATEIAQRWVAEHKIVLTRTPPSIPAELWHILGIERLEDAGWAAVVEHELVAFPSYPHEWPPEMFERAARLTLELAVGILSDAFRLKDGAPWNILFCGTEPVFVDLLSFERREPFECIWLPYGQFQRTFLLPLLLWRKTGAAPGQHFLLARDGLVPGQCVRLLGFWRAVTPLALRLCTVPAIFEWLTHRFGKSAADIKPGRARSLQEALYILKYLLRGLERSLNRVSARVPAKSRWTDYTAEVRVREFAPGYFAAKCRIVQEILAQLAPASCLDVGCNTGHFSLMAARMGTRVVAIDRDVAAVGAVYSKARQEHLEVLPLVVDLARPTPAVGWRNGESLSFLDRAVRANFDMVMLLAFVHHLCLIERVPLAEVARLTAALTRRWMLVEFVPHEDRMARQMPGVWIGDSAWSGYNKQIFEAAFGRYFRPVRVEALADSGRWLYLMERVPEKRA